MRGEELSFKNSVVILPVCLYFALFSQTVVEGVFMCSVKLTPVSL